MKLPSIKFAVPPQPMAAALDPGANWRPNPATEGSNSREIFLGHLAPIRVERCDEPFGMIA